MKTMIEYAKPHVKQAIKAIKRHPDSKILEVNSRRIKGTFLALDVNSLCRELKVGTTGYLKYGRRHGLNSLKLDRGCYYGIRQD